MEYQATDRDRPQPPTDDFQASRTWSGSNSAEGANVTNWHGVSRDWSDRKAALEKEWNHLTKEDIEGIDANRLSLLERLQARYGWTAEESSYQVESWLDRARRLRFL